MAMAGWSPELAMDAYLHTLQLCKQQEEHADDASDSSSSSSVVMEPRSMEYIAALAAGSQARLLLDVAPAAASPATAVALAVAAARTGGRVACVRDDPRSLDGVRRHLHRHGLAASADFHLARPSATEAAVVRQLRCVDFAVVDASLERCGGVLGAVDVNPRGAIVVVTNVFQEETTTRRSSGRVCSYGQVVGKKGRATVLPIGRHGIEVTRVGGGSSGAHLQPHKKVVSTPKRTFLVCDDGSPS
ncbi:uncharacterized protein LOC102714312 [Oryza brachyantha]|uniref:uncharacterized protein LOC102714312 n=1 Tax=Oryza brachyantha TaxID=4533 RepID=UPI001ADBAD66|nr:uncharacterized protein LOC102714312 [Oryza brachyantha]